MLLFVNNHVVSIKYTYLEEKKVEVEKQRKTTKKPKAIPVLPVGGLSAFSYVHICMAKSCLNLVILSQTTMTTR